MDARAVTFGSDRWDTVRRTALLQLPVNPDVDRLTRLAARLLHADIAAIFVLDDEVLQVKSQWGLPEPWPTCREIESPGTLTEHVVATGERVAITDARTDPDWHSAPTVALLGAVGHLAVPMVLEGQTVGAFLVLTRQPRVWAEADTETLTELAQSALAQFRLQLEVERHRATVEALQASRDRLEESHTLLGSILEGTNDLVFAKDRSGRYVMANRATNRFLVGLEGTVVGRTDPELMPPELAAQVVESDRRVMAENASLTREETLALPGRPPAHFIVTKAPRRDADGQVIGVVGVRHDITARRTAEDALREREALFRAIYDQAVVGLVLLDREGRIRSANAAFARLVGRPAEALRGLPCASLLHPDDVDEDAAAWAHLTRGDLTVYHLERRYLHADGEPLWTHVSTSEIRDDQGRVNGYFRIVRDISEYKRLAEQFVQAQKMEAIGKLAGGVAHDFNNMLAVINGYSEMLLDVLPAESQARGSLAQIQKAGWRAADLTRQILAFSRREMLEPRPLNVNAVVEDTEKMLRRLIGEHIALDTQLAAELPPIQADAGQLMQVLMNLAVNARDAMPGSGCLTIGTQAVELQPWHELVAEGLAPGRYVRLSVSDTGHGMPEAVRRRVFEPFYTTKASGRGSGLGLSTVYDIVAQAGGHIAVTSGVNQGTVFHLHLPAVVEPVEHSTTAPLDERPRGNETVLVVEDDPAVRRIVCSLLASLDYRVLPAEQAEQALALSRCHPGQVDLLLTDVILPGMNGRDLARVLTRERPALKVLYMSGYDGDPSAASAFDGVTPLRKPFSHRKLAEAVRQCLDEGPVEQVTAAPK